MDEDLPYRWDRFHRSGPGPQYTETRLGAAGARSGSRKCCRSLDCQKQNASLVRGNVTSRQGLEQAVTGTDVLVHNAGVYEFGADSDAAKRMQTVNVEGTQNMLAAAKAAGVARTIYVSTVWALGPSGRPPSPSIERDGNESHDGRYLTAYERTKAEAHQVALRWRAQGLAIAMPNGVVGANDHGRSVTSSDSRCSAPCCLWDLAVTPF